VLEYANDSLKVNREVVLEAVRNNSNALEYAHDSLKADREVVLEAVMSNGDALSMSSEELQNDPDLQKIAAQVAFNNVCSQEDSKDENEGVRIFGATASIGKWLRLEQELTHIEIWRQAMGLARTVIENAYGLTEIQLTNANNKGLDLANTYFELDTSNYSGFMESLGVAGKGNDLSPKGKGDLISLLQVLRIVVQEYETEDVIDKYTNNINATCIQQLKGGGILDKSQEIAEQYFGTYKKDMLAAHPIPLDD
jgi:hypothetical protein